MKCSYITFRETSGPPLRRGGSGSSALSLGSLPFVLLFVIHVTAGLTTLLVLLTTLPLLVLLAALTLLLTALALLVLLAALAVLALALLALLFLVVHY